MSSQWADYQNLFGSDDEDEGAPSQSQSQSQSSQPTPAAPAPAPASAKKAAPANDDFDDEDEEEEEEQRKPKKRVHHGDAKKKAKKPEKEAPKPKASKPKGSGLSRVGDELEEEEAAAARKRRQRELDDVQDSEEEYDAGEERKKQRGGKATGRVKQESDKKKSEVEQALEKLKKKKKIKLSDEDINRMCQEVTELMTAAALEDKLALNQGKPAVSKLKHLETVMISLRNKQLQHQLTEHHGLLRHIAAWLTPLADKTLPLYPVRTPLINLLVELHVEISQLKESGIGKVVQMLHRHPDETQDNKAKLNDIIDSWSRLLTGKNSQKRQRTDDDDERGNQKGQRADAYFVATTARGVEIPIRTGFNFRVMPMSKSGGRDDDEDDGGVGHADEAMEVNEREPRDPTVESKASRVRKAMKDLKRGSGKVRHVNVSH